MRLLIELRQRTDDLSGGPPSATDPRERQRSAAKVVASLQQALCARRPHVPTSVALAQLLHEAPQDHVSLAWLMGRPPSEALLRSRHCFSWRSSVWCQGGNIHRHSAAFPAVQMMLGRAAQLFRALWPHCHSKPRRLCGPHHSSARANGDAGPPAPAHAVPGDALQARREWCVGEFSGGRFG